MPRSQRLLRLAKYHRSRARHAEANLEFNRQAFELLLERARREHDDLQKLADDRLRRIYELEAALLAQPTGGHIRVAVHRGPGAVPELWDQLEGQGDPRV